MQNHIIIELEKCYSDYIVFANKNVRNASVGDGLLGMGKSPTDAAGHDVFFEKVEEITDRFVAQKDCHEFAFDFAKIILTHAATVNESDPSYWYMFASHVHAQKVIGLISTEKRHELAILYNQLYPKNKRLPVQNKIYKALKQ